MGAGGEPNDQDDGVDDAQTNAKKLIDLSECLLDAPSFR